MHIEKRHFQRIMHDAEATLSIGDSIIPCTILDISLKGCLLKLLEAKDLNKSETYPLSIKLGEDVKIEMDISPTHINEEKVGAVCMRIDLDSITHLRRLVELNLDDPNLLERELHEFIHFQYHKPE